MNIKTLNYSRIFKWALALAVITASGISLYIGLKQSVWYDEAFSILMAKYPWKEIVRMTSEDVHPPFYYWTLKAWTLLFGSGELAVRSLSTLFLGASVGMAGLLVKRMFGAKTAIIALPFIVFAPFLLRYGFEVRMYALASLIGISATYLLVVATETVDVRRRRLLLAIYGILVALGVYTLYFVAFLWITHLAWLAWYTFKQKRRLLFIEGIAAFAFSFLLFLPWLPAFLGRADGKTMPAITHALGFEGLLGLLTFDFLYHPPWHLSAVAIMTVVFVVLALIYLGIEGFRHVGPTKRPYLVLLGVYAGVPILLFVIISHIRPMYVERYLSHVIIGGYVFIGILAGLAVSSRKKLPIAVASVLGLVLLFGCMQLVTTGNYNFQRLQKPAVKQMAARLTDCKNGAVIFAEDPQIAIELGYYVKNCPIYFYNETAYMTGGYVMLSGSPLRVGDPAKELDWAHKVFYIYYDDPKRTLPSDLRRDDDVVSMGSMHLATYVQRN